MKLIQTSIQAALLSCLMIATAFAQAPNMGTTTQFVLFSSNGAVTNTGNSLLTGDVGSNNGSSTGFGNVNGSMHSNNGATAQCATDLLVAYLQLDAAVPDFTIGTFLGTGDTLEPGVYLLNGATALDGELVLDAQGHANTVYIFQIEGSLSANVNSKVKLINGAMACNVFWKVEGMINIAAGCTMRGNLIANNAAIEFNANDSLEGRALTTAGAITIDGVLAYTPIGCGSPVLEGPALPAMGTTECYAIFSSNGPVSNTGLTLITGDVGSNNGLTTGFDSLMVAGTVHSVPDASTAACAVDLATLYTTLNTLSPDIKLLYPAQFGNHLTLTPHTYLLDGAVTFTDSLYLDAQGERDAVFVIQVNGALSTSTYSKVILLHEAQAKNVFWKVEGAVEINDYSAFVGTIVCNNGALNLFSTGVTLDGRALTTGGSLSTTAIDATVSSICALLGIDPGGVAAPSILFAPNPFTNFQPLHVTLGAKLSASELQIFDAFGRQVLFARLTAGTTALSPEQLVPGMYFYRLRSSGRAVQTGRLVVLR